MQNEKDYLNHCKNKLQNHDFGILVYQIVYDITVFETLDNTLCL